MRGEGKIAFTYIEGELAVGVIRNYEWIVGRALSRSCGSMIWLQETARQPNPHNFKLVGKARILS